MTRLLLISCVSMILFDCIATPARAGAIVEGDGGDQNVGQTVVDDGAVYHFNTLQVGMLVDNNNVDMVEAFPLPYLAPGQTVSAAAISFYLEQNAPSQANPNYNVQLYGLNRVSATSAVPILADWYVGTNDTANTLLAAKFVTPSTPVNHACTYSGANLVSFIDTQYANPAFSSLEFSNSRYVFFRLNADLLNPNNGANNYLFASARNPNRSYHPMLSLTISGGISNVAGRLQFSFSLPQASSTSAGVYDTSTGALIRTLWNNVQYQGGTNDGAWDGKDDSGNAVSTGTSYQIKLIYHNVQYVWQGMVGNTSAATSGPNVYHSYLFWTDMSISGSTAYYANGYNEAQNPFHYFKVGSPQTPYEINYGYDDSSSSMNFMTSDSSRTYWAKCAGGFAANGTFIVALNNDGSLYTFPQGTTPGGTQTYFYTSCCDYDGAANQANPSTGLAVQQGATGDLFVSHGSLNLVRVFDKVQGNLLGSFSVPNPGRLATAADGDVWVTSNGPTPAVYRYSFSNGAATLKQTITGLTLPAGVGVSADGTLVLVADGGTSQQVKAYSNTSRAITLSTPLWTYGDAGGMAFNGPAITPHSFDYDTQTYIAFQSDNTFWIGDYGNRRILHFSINGTTLTYIEQIAFLPASYQSTVDLTDATRVFNQFFEYSVNYSLPLAGTNGSWTLVRNWLQTLPKDSTHNYIDGRPGFNNVVTLSNGLTYGLAANSVTGNLDLFELPATGPARLTGISFGNNPRIYEDGSMRFNLTAPNNASLSFYSQPLTGFDAENNPIWGSPAVLATRTLAANDPIPWAAFPMRTEITASGNVIDFDGSVDNVYHLAGLPLGKTAWQWRSDPSVNGAPWFPQDGHFEVGNGVQYPGNYASALGRNIIYGYHGEFWAGGEASKWVNYYDNGLMVGIFGTPSNGANVNDAVDGFAGNSFAWTLVKASDGNVYLYHNDESNHGGTVRWRIDGWDGITELNATSSLGSTASLSTNTAGPFVAITSPPSGVNYLMNGSSITLSAQAGNSGASITSVQFFDGSTSLGTVTSAPYVLTYGGLSAGSHTLTATATDSNGLSTTSAPVTISMGTDGTNSLPPAPVSLSASANTSQSMVLQWTQPTVGPTSSTIGQIISFQCDAATESNALGPTDVAGAAPYAVSHFNIFGQTRTNGLTFISPTANSGATLPNLGINCGMFGGGAGWSIGSLTGTTQKLFSNNDNCAYVPDASIAISAIPYARYDVVVYSLPDQIRFHPTPPYVTSFVTVNAGGVTSTVQQTFTVLSTTYTSSPVPFGASTSVTDTNTIVFQGLSGPSFKLQGPNVSGFQIVERPYDQGMPTSYTIQRALGTSGNFVTIGTAAGTATTYTDATVESSTGYVYRVIANGATGSSGSSNSLTVTTLAGTPLVTFPEWQVLEFGDNAGNPLIAGPNSIPQNDGVPNLLKYLCDLDPTEPLTGAQLAALPRVGLDTTSPGTTYLTLTYRQNPLITGITINVQTSSDLITWSTVSPPDISRITGADPVTGDPIMEVGVKCTDSTKQFIRLNVSYP